MHNSFYKYIFPIFLVLFLLGCKKNKIGGNATIKGKAVHHNKPIGNTTIYIKYGATEFPGENTENYNTEVVTDAEGNFSISVYKGDYFLYGIGEDKAIPPPYIVKGGQKVSIRNREVVDIILAITE
jgi:hypothetical protein